MRSSYEVLRFERYWLMLDYFIKQGPLEEGAQWGCILKKISTHSISTKCPFMYQNKCKYFVNVMRDEVKRLNKTSVRRFSFLFKIIN